LIFWKRFTSGEVGRDLTAGKILGLPTALAGHSRFLGCFCVEGAQSLLYLLALAFGAFNLEFVVFRDA
jgi:hypothetical protein